MRAFVRQWCDYDERRGIVIQNQVAVGERENRRGNQENSLNDETSPTGGDVCSRRVPQMVREDACWRGRSARTLAATAGEDEWETPNFLTNLSRLCKLCLIGLKPKEFRARALGEWQSRSLLSLAPHRI